MTEQYENEEVDPQLMADFEEFMAQKSQTKQPVRTREQIQPERSAPPLKEEPVIIPKSKKAINCEKARAKRTEYAALRKEVEYLREVVKQRNLTDQSIGHMGPAPSKPAQFAYPNQPVPQPLSAPTNAHRRPEMVLNFD